MGGTVEDLDEENEREGIEFSFLADKLVFPNEKKINEKLEKRNGNLSKRREL